jgi:hypothetical protein
MVNRINTVMDDIKSVYGVAISVAIVLKVKAKTKSGDLLVWA